MEERSDGGHETDTTIGALSCIQRSLWMAWVFGVYCSDMLDSLFTVFLDQPHLFLFIGLALGFTLLLVRHVAWKKEKRILNFGSLVILAGLVIFFVGAILNVHIFGCGYVRSFDEAFIQGDTLIAVDHLADGDDIGKIEEAYRLHGVDLRTGKKRFRIMLGDDYPRIIAYSSTTVVVRYGQEVAGRDSYVGYDLQTGEKVFDIDRKSFEQRLLEGESAGDTYATHLPQKPGELRYRDIFISLMGGEVVARPRESGEFLWRLRL